MSLEKSHENSPYDDQLALTEYLWRNYLGLFSEHELLAHQILQAEQKAENATSPALQDLLRKRYASREREEIASLLAEGADSFRTNAAARLLSQRDVAVVVNRCPSCSCILQTPVAKQCLWCGHDWHSPV